MRLEDDRGVSKGAVVEFVAGRPGTVVGAGQRQANSEEDGADGRDGGL